MFLPLFKNRKCSLTDLLYLSFNTNLLLLQHFYSDLKPLHISINLESGLSYCGNILDVVDIFKNVERLPALSESGFINRLLLMLFRVYS
jgi:hypothetical protein